MIAFSPWSSFKVNKAASSPTHEERETSRMALPDEEGLLQVYPTSKDPQNSKEHFNNKTFEGEYNKDGNSPSVNSSDDEDDDDGESYELHTAGSSSGFEWSFEAGDFTTKRFFTMAADKRRNDNVADTTTNTTNSNDPAKSDVPLTIDRSSLKRSKSSRSTYTTKSARSSRTAPASMNKKIGVDPEISTMTTSATSVTDIDSRHVNMHHAGEAFEDNVMYNSSHVERRDDVSQSESFTSSSSCSSSKVTEISELSFPLREAPPSMNGNESRSEVSASLGDAESGGGGTYQGDDQNKRRVSRTFYSDTYDQYDTDSVGTSQTPPAPPSVSSSKIMRNILKLQTRQKYQQDEQHQHFLTQEQNTPTPETLSDRLQHAMDQTRMELAAANAAAAAVEEKEREVIRHTTSSNVYEASPRSSFSTQPTNPTPPGSDTNDDFSSLPSLNIGSTPPSSLPPPRKGNKGKLRRSSSTSSVSSFRMFRNNNGGCYSKLVVAAITALIVASAFFALVGLHGIPGGNREMTPANLPSNNHPGIIQAPEDTTPQQTKKNNPLEGTKLAGVTPSPTTTTKTVITSVPPPAPTPTLKPTMSPVVLNNKPPVAAPTTIPTTFSPTSLKPTTAVPTRSPITLVEKRVNEMKNGRNKNNND